MFKADNILISPIRAVLNKLEDTTADFILCSSEMIVETANRKNVLFFSFFDTEEDNPSMSFQYTDAEKIVLFLSRAMPILIFLSAVTAVNPEALQLRPPLSLRSAKQIVTSGIIQTTTQISWYLEKCVELLALIYLRKQYKNARMTATLRFAKQ